MKRTKVIMLLSVFAITLAYGVLPAFAQRGHAGGIGGGTRMEPPSGGMGAPATSRANHGPYNLPAMGERKTPEQLLSQNTKLSARLQSLLAVGTSPQAAARGFNNLGQFVAAVHVSHNLGIPFSQLKAEMAGSGMSLGKAIHQLKPNVNAKSELKRARKEAKEDLKRAGS